MSRSSHGPSATSRYIFYEDSTFALQFKSTRFGVFEYGGRFVRTDAKIQLSFNGRGVAWSREASGTLNGDALSVTYNAIMSLSDFVDGVYLRAR